MSKDPYSIIIRPLQTEKANREVENDNSYRFEVALDANKIEIKRAIETIYAHKKIKVKKVRTISKHPKARRVRFHVSTTKAWKQAIVSLDKESKLEF